MHGRRVIVGLCVLSALLISAFAAQSALAVNGTTAFTCVDDGGPVPGGQFSDAHCKVAEPGGRYTHKEITQDLTTHVTVTNEGTGPGTTTATIQRLKSTVAGAAIELQATGVHGLGGLTNKKDAGTGEHFIHGKNLPLKYTGVTEKLLGCKVTGKPGGAGTVETKPLTATTAGKGDSIVFTPTEGTTFAEFELTECAIGPITIKVVGSLTCKPEGATINCKHEEATAAKTLRLQSGAGPVAGLEGVVTVKGAKEGEVTKPISVTTVNTP